MQVDTIFKLSNGYVVEIRTLGPQKQAFLLDSSGNVVQTGPKSLSSTKDFLFEILLQQYQPEGIYQDRNSWEVLPTIVERLGPPGAKPPSVREYKVEGRIANKDTQEPVVGVKISIKTQLPKKDEPLVNEPQTFETESDDKGSYILTFKIRVEEIEKDVFHVLEVPKIKFDGFKQKFASESKSPYTYLSSSEQIVKSSLDVVLLKPFIADLKKETTKYKNLANKEITKLKNLIPKDSFQSLQKGVGKKIKDLIKKYLPLIIGMIAEFGISKLKEEVENKFKNFNKKDCPSPDRLKKLIKKRNQIVKILNSIYKFVDALVKTTGIVLSLFQIFKLIKNITINIPVPQSIGTPPAKDFGGLISSLPMSATLKSSSALDQFEKFIAKYEGLTIMILSILTVLRAVLKLAIDLLKGLDTLLQICAQDYLDKEEITLEEIDAELLASLDENEEVKSDPFINGFKISVMETQQKVGSLKRRQAVAKNQKGIILLKGEPSFSANDKILIDELKFYITQNNLKAN